MRLHLQDGGGVSFLRTQMTRSSPRAMPLAVSPRLSSPNGRTTTARRMPCRSTSTSAIGFMSRPTTRWSQSFAASSPRGVRVCARSAADPLWSSAAPSTEFSISDSAPIPARSRASRKEGARKSPKSNATLRPYKHLTNHSKKKGEGHSKKETARNLWQRLRHDQAGQSRQADDRQAGLAPLVCLPVVWQRDRHRRQRKTAQEAPQGTADSVRHDRRRRDS